MPLSINHEVNTLQFPLLDHNFEYTYRPHLSQIETFKFYLWFFILQSILAQ